MKARFIKKSFFDSDNTTYILVGFIVVVVVLGALKIIFL
jgi:hypothetical protein